jgi:predicted RNA-binding protein (virulence factor B family)
MKKPLIWLGKVKRLRVADVHPRLGAFLEMGLGRQLLLPFSEQPEFKPLRPQVDDEVYVYLAHDKQGRLYAKLANDEELAPLVFSAPQSWQNTWVGGWVTRSLKIGAFVVLDGGVIGFGVLGFIPLEDSPERLRVGERVNVRITFIREDGRVNGTLFDLKQVSRVSDADRLLSFLKARPGGAMPYSDATGSDIIKERFGISKGAFKRALGKLMHDGLVSQDGNWTRLVPEDEVAARVAAVKQADAAKRTAVRQAEVAAKQADAAKRATAKPPDAAKQTASEKTTGKRAAVKPASATSVKPKFGVAQARSGAAAQPPETRPAKVSAKPKQKH